MSSKTYSLHAVRQKFKETHPGITDTIEFTIDDSKDAPKFHIEHPMFQSNKTKRAIAKATEANSDLGIAKAVLGDQWDDYDKAGGTVADVMLLINQVTEEMTDTTPDGTPTQR